MMHMRRSRVLERLRKNDVVTCFKTNLADARATELAALFGFDCIWTDLEHTANDWRTIEQQIWAAKTQDVDVLVRVARGSYSDYVRPFELDASGIMVPHLMSGSDARDVARITRYRPVGRRALDAGNADARYFNLDYAGYLRESNENRFVVVQIEDVEALVHLDEIASVAGIDMLFFGPGDFSHSIGAPGQWDDPRITQARATVARAAVAHGKVAATVGGVSGLAELLDLGYRFINLGADVVGLSQYCKGIMESFSKAVGR